METSAQGDTRGVLSRSLCRIATDEAQIHSLHDVLGPFCHESRNILNSLKMSLYLARRGDAGTDGIAWDELDRSYDEVEHLFDRIQTIVRPVRLTLVRLPLGLLIEDRRRSWAESFAGRERTLEVVGPEESDPGEYDPQRLGQALDAFVAWRADEGGPGETATLRAGSAEGRFTLEWIEADVRARGKRRKATGTKSTARPEPLALPFLSRVIIAHGGALEVVKPVGRHVRLSWPRYATR